MATPNTTKKDSSIKESIVRNTLIFNIIVFIVGFLLYFLYFSPKIDEVTAQKDFLLSEEQKYNTLKWSGFTLPDLKNIPGSNGADSIFSELDDSFYETNLKNTTFATYQEFLDDKQKYLQNINTNDSISKRDAALASVLPEYIQGWSMTGSVMSDFDFVNYMERLIHSFHLVTTSSMGVGNLVPVETSTDAKKNKLSAQVYSIPLELSLQWRKADIVSFLYFLQKVWDVQKVNGEEIVFFRDKILRLVLAGDKWGPTYNIYQNKLANIDSITFSKYIDTTSTPRPEMKKTTLGFLSYITEGREKDETYSVTMTLSFFVRGLPIYKVKDEVDSVIARYKDLQSKMNVIMSKLKTTNVSALSEDQIDKVRNLNTLDSFIKEMNKSIVQLEQSKGKDVDYQELYKVSSKVNLDLDNVEKAYNKINIDSLNLNQ